jgi:hypothetical protein
MFAELFAVVQPKDPKVAIGLSFLARGKGSPLYDPVALLATLKALSPSSPSLVPTAPTVGEAQAMLDSAPSGILAPATKAALVISTDVSLRSADGTADTDDRIMLVLLCYFLARLASSENVHSVTIALSARKKGSKDKRDATTPADVVQFMRERIGFFGAAVTSGLNGLTGLEAQGPSFASFGINGVEVRVFQLQAQTTPSPEEKLDAAGLVAQDTQIAELREANAAMFECLEAARHEAPIFFTGCGPIDVALALFLAEHARGGYTISFGSGVNGGDGEKFKDQATHCGGLVLLGAVVDIGPGVTRELVTPPGIVLLDDQKGAEASVKNTFKVIGSPMITPVNDASADSQRATGLALRIFVSNLTSFFGREALAGLAAQCEGSTDQAFPVVEFPYSHSLALTMVTGLLIAHGAVIDLATLADRASTASTASNFAALSALAMPPSLAATIKANIAGISTVAGLYKLIALGMDARLGAIMAEWHSISSISSSSALSALSALKGLAAIPAPVVSTATPIITEAGLALGQPF